TEQNLRVRHRTISKTAGVRWVAPPACRSPAPPDFEGGWRRGGGSAPVAEPASSSPMAPPVCRVRPFCPHMAGAAAGGAGPGLFSREGEGWDGPSLALGAYKRVVN